MDPILGIATGAFAYYIFETDPRNAGQRPPGRSLLDLTSRYINGERAPYTLYTGPNPLGNRIERTAGEGRAGYIPEPMINFPIGSLGLTTEDYVYLETDNIPRWFE
jgi:hypothetical protein